MTRVKANRSATNMADTIIAASHTGLLFRPHVTVKNTPRNSANDRSTASSATFIFIINTHFNCT